MKSVSIWKRHVWQCIFAISIVTLMTFSYASAQTVNPALDGRIVYLSVQGKGQTRAFYSANPDGSATQKLFTVPAGSAWLCMSSDGNMIVYEVLDTTASVFRIWTMNGEGTHAVKLPKVGKSCVYPSVDAHGNKIAFRAATSGSAQAYVMSAKGKGVVKISYSPIFISESPVLNPQGNLVILRSTFQKWNRSDSSWHTLAAFYLATADGKDGYALTPTREDSLEVDFNPAFSPDSQRIVFVSKNNEGNNTGTSNTPSPKQTSDICIVNKDGSNLIRQMHSKDIYKSPHFSPDGKYIVFNRKETKTSAKWQIWIMKTDGNDPHCIVKGAGDCNLVQWVGLPEKVQK